MIHNQLRSRRPRTLAEILAQGPTLGQLASRNIGPTNQSFMPQEDPYAQPTRTIATEQPYVPPTRTIATEQPYIPPTRTIAQEPPYQYPKTSAVEQPYIPPQRTWSASNSVAGTKVNGDPDGYPTPEGWPNLPGPKENGDPGGYPTPEGWPNDVPGKVSPKEPFMRPHLLDGGIYSWRDSDMPGVVKYPTWTGDYNY